MAETQHELTFKGTPFVFAQVVYHLERRRLKAARNRRAEGATTGEALPIFTFEPLPVLTDADRQNDLYGMPVSASAQFVRVRFRKPGMGVSGAYSTATAVGLPDGTSEITATVYDEDAIWWEILRAELTPPAAKATEAPQPGKPKKAPTQQKPGGCRPMRVRSPQEYYHRLYMAQAARAYQARDPEATWRDVGKAIKWDRGLGDAGLKMLSRACRLLEEATAEDLAAIQK